MTGEWEPELHQEELKKMWRAHVQLLLRVLFTYCIRRSLQHGITAHTQPPGRASAEALPPCTTHSALGGQGELCGFQER